MQAKVLSGADSLDRKPLTRPGLRDIAGQSFRDFVGKDVQQTTTYSYVWSADQAGHFMLGFAPTFVIHWIGLLLYAQFGVVPWLAGEYGLLYAAAVVMCGWTLLELYDLYDSIRKIRHSTGYFAANTANLVWNVATALFYFLTGAAVAGASQFGPAAALAAVAVLFAVQLPVAIWWLRIKIIFQQAGLPYLYRLPNFDGVFDVAKGANGQYDPAAQKGAVEFVVGLTAAPPRCATTDVSGALRRQHLIVTGPLNSGKTSLGVGIGTEFAFNGGIGRYTDMSDLVQYTAADVAAALDSEKGRSPHPEEHEFNDGRILWKWPSVDLLIVDDVIELLLPVRRSLEQHLQGDVFTAEQMARLMADAGLVQQLGGPDVAKRVLEVVLGRLRTELLAYASPEVIARYVAQSFTRVIRAIERIPRVVWVLGDMIRPDLFEQFVRGNFGFTQPGHEDDVRVLELLPPANTGK